VSREKRSAENPSPEDVRWAATIFSRLGAVKGGSAKTRKKSASSRRNIEIARARLKEIRDSRKTQ
jgi:hypothetical protein